MRRRNKHYGMLFIVICAIFVLNIAVAAAVDELFLTGVVKNVDVKARSVTVDVMSKSCKGERHFSVDKVSDYTGLVGKRISFTINSSSCEDNRSLKIVQIKSKGEQR
jgi:hypothetical protein